MTIVAVAAVFATVRTAYMFWTQIRTGDVVPHDLHVQYLAWENFVTRETAWEVMSHPTYLPHAWLLLTPFFLLGWQSASSLWFLLGFTLHTYSARQIADYCELTPANRILFYCLYFSTASVAMSIVLGNPIVISFAAILAALPFVQFKEFSRTTKGHIYLFVSSIKHIAVYPVFGLLLLKRPRSAVPATLAVLAIFFASLVWAKVPLSSVLDNLRRGQQEVNGWMHETPGISFVPVFEPLGTTGQLILWISWILLFIKIVTLKDPLAQFFALLLIALMPLHHREYDLVVATPVIALLLKRENVLGALMVTALLTGIGDTLIKHFALVDHQTKVRMATCFYESVVAALVWITIWSGSSKDTRKLRVLPPT